MFIPVEQIKEGDYVELAGDQYADPDGEYLALEYGFAIALHDAYRETPECTTLHIEDVDLFGFPVGHLVRVVGNAEGYENGLNPGDTCMCGYRKEAQ